MEIKSGHEQQKYFSLQTTGLKQFCDCTIAHGKNVIQYPGQLLHYSHYISFMTLFLSPKASIINYMHVVNYAN